MTSSPIIIDKSRCTGCGLCVKGCGFGALHFVDAPGANKLNRIAEVDAGACRACSACVNACKFKAISEVKQEVVGTANLESYRDLWVFAEQTNGKIAEVAFELLSKGLELKAARGDGCRLCAVLLGSGINDNLAGELTSAGADLVYVVDDPKLKDYDASVYTEALALLAEKHKPEIILAGATAIGRSFFARVAARLRTGLTADCTALEIKESGRGRPDNEKPQILLHQSRPAFGGNIMATIMTPNHRPQMATVRPKVFKKKVKVTATALIGGEGAAETMGRKFGGEGAAETRRDQRFVTAAPPPPSILREALDLGEPLTHTLEILRDPNAIDITSAEVLVAGGRGLKSAENFGRLKELADLLHGEVAASRAAVDAGWATVARQVGQTGRTVAPRLYLAFGISGAIQHLEGIRGADRVIAVNNDPNAPIFGVATLGIVGDAMEVIEAMIKELKQ